MPLIARILLWAILLAGICLLLARALRAYLRFKNGMVVTCPETKAPVGVRVDARHAAITDSLGRGSLRLAHCTRWPEREACGRECLQQIETSPESCMIRKKLESWYRGKSCACCDRGIGEIRWREQKPALVGPDHKLLQWKDVPAEDLTGVLATHEPVCGTCNFAERW